MFTLEIGNTVITNDFEGYVSGFGTRNGENIVYIDVPVANGEWEYKWAYVSEIIEVIE